MVDDGCTVYPPMASIYLRYYWHVVFVKNRYLHYGKSGYQYVGISITGLSLLSTGFGVSTEYFDTKVS